EPPTVEARSKPDSLLSKAVQAIWSWRIVAKAKSGLGGALSNTMPADVAAIERGLKDLLREMDSLAKALRVDRSANGVAARLAPRQHRSTFCSRYGAACVRRAARAE